MFTENKKLLTGLRSLTRTLTTKQETSRKRIVAEICGFGLSEIGWALVLAALFALDDRASGYVAIRLVRNMAHRGECPEM
jgi:hypothetical protein